MATIKKSNKKKIIIPICLVLVIAIIATVIGVTKANSGIETVTLTTITTDSISETVSATGDVTAGAVRNYKVASIATCKEVFVKVGDKVKKGDVLATFDTEKLDQQVTAVQATYDSACTAYANAVAAQKSAKAKLASINPEIKELEAQLAKLKQDATTTTTTKKVTTTQKETTTKKETTTRTATTMPYSSTTTTTSTTVTTTVADPAVPGFQYDSVLISIADNLSELVDAISAVSADVESTNEMTRIVMQVVAQEIQSGNFDSELIAQQVGDAVSQAINDGIVRVVDSGVAVQTVQAAVAAVDWKAIGSGFAQTNSVNTATVELRLAALYAEKELYTAQADQQFVSAQKKVRDSAKQTLDTLKESQEDLKAGWVASITGVVTECNLSPNVQTTLLENGITIENMNSMVATISLGEYDIHKVKVGMPATIKSAYGQYTGEVATIAPTATGGSQGSVLDNVGSMAGISGLSSLTSSGAGVQCTVTINNPDENIIPGFQASVEIQVGDYEGVPVVPIESIVLEKEGSFVYLYNAEDETVTKTQIETGAISDSAYEIVSGLSVGDQIVSTPSGTYEEDTFRVKVSNDKK